MSRKRTSKLQRRSPARRQGLFIILGVAALAVIAVIVLISQNAQPAVVGGFNTVEKQDWPQPDGKTLGPADAPVVVREFSDFQCPFCRQFSSSVEKQIIDQYLSTGKVRFEYRHFIVIDGNVGGSESRHAAQASECASEQGAFWDYHEMLFANQQGEGQGAFSDARLKAFAEALELDTAAFNSCLNSARAAKAVSDDERLARTYNLRGTPSLFVNDQLVQNPMDLDAVKAAIDAALASASK